jgi:hypothetical protein
MSARIGIRLSARTMAGAHITEATPPTKMRLRVSIEPPNINVSEITLQFVRGQVSHHDRMPVTLEPEELERVAHRGKVRYIPVQAVNSRSEGARGHGPSIRTTAAPKATASFTVLHRSILWCVLLQVIMTTADTPAPKEAITAALLVIGDKILSGRTKDQNIGYVAEYLTALGMHLAEAGSRRRRDGNR